MSNASFSLAKATWAAGDFKSQLVERVRRPATFLNVAADNVAGVTLPIFHISTDPSVDGEVRCLLSRWRKRKRTRTGRMLTSSAWTELLPLNVFQSRFLSLSLFHCPFLRLSFFSLSFCGSLSPSLSSRNAPTLSLSQFSFRSLVVFIDSPETLLPRLFLVSFRHKTCKKVVR